MLFLWMELYKIYFRDKIFEAILYCLLICKLVDISEPYCEKIFKLYKDAYFLDSLYLE